MDIGNLLIGSEPRRTVMLKSAPACLPQQNLIRTHFPFFADLPNTFTREGELYSRSHLITSCPNITADIRRMLDAVIPREYDYLYCRHDFNNGANLGYAFVSVVTLCDLFANSLVLFRSTS